MIIGKCKDCEWSWTSVVREYGQSRDKHECRLNPPVVVVLAAGGEPYTVTEWPEVDLDTGFCSKFDSLLGED